MGEKNFSEFFREYNSSFVKDEVCRRIAKLTSNTDVSVSKPLPFEQVMGTEVPIEAKTFVDVYGRNIIAKICKNGFISKTVTVMPDVVNVRIGGNETNKVIFVDFADNTTEKAILSVGDTFSLEQGISICIAKKLLNDKCGAGSSLYNKIVRRALKVFDLKDKAKIAEVAKRENEEKKFEKIKAKKEERRIKREEAERERQIEIQKEAYLRAMREYNESTETGQNK